MDRALTALVVSLVLSACDLTAPAHRACGVDPALAVAPTGGERAREGEYVMILRRLDEYRGYERVLRWYAEEMPWLGVTFFRAGESLDVLRGGDLSDRTLLVRRHEERFWTTVAEASC